MESFPSQKKSGLDQESADLIHYVPFLLIVLIDSVPEFTVLYILIFCGLDMSEEVAEDVVSM